MQLNNPEMSRVEAAKAEWEAAQKEAVELERFTSAVDKGCETKLTAAHGALVAMEVEQHKQRLALIDKLFDKPADEQDSIPEAFRRAESST